MESKVEASITNYHISYAIKSSCEDAFLNSSIHGLNGIARSKLLVLKLAWLLLFLGSASYCTYLISLSVQAYLSYEVVTNLYVDAEIPAKFPRVTICNENSIMTEYGFNFTKRILDSTNQYLTGVNSSLYFYYLNNRIWINSVAFFDQNVNNSQLSLSLDDMLISCSYAGVPCSSSDFVYKFSTWYGSCYQFNSGKYANGTTAPDLMVAKSGWYDGLVLELYVGNPTNPYSLSTSSGLHVYVNNKTLYDGIFDGFAAQPGTNSLIGVSRTFSENLPAPYSECVSDDDIEKSDSVLVKAILSTGYKYRFSDCALMCWVQYSIDKCHCQDIIGMTFFDNITVCLEDKQSTCASREYVTFFQQDVKKLCKDRCPVECSSIEYEIKTTALSYPSQSYYKYLLRQPYFQDRNLTSMSYDQIKSSILAVNINYESMTYTRIEKSPKMELLDLIGSIGGTLGLFVGTSFMSFFEIVDLGIVVSYLVCQGLFVRFNSK